MLYRINKDISIYGNDINTFLKNSFKKLSKTYNVHIQYNDIIGLFNTENYGLSSLLLEYCSHNNCFCKYIKKSNSCFLKCLSIKNKISACASKHNHPFYGSCYFGVEEFIFPVQLNDNIIGFINIGEFYTDREKAEEKVLNTAKEFKLDADVCVEKFFSMAKKIDFCIDELCTDVCLISAFISKYAATIMPQDTKILTNNTKHFIVQQAIEFIDKNYSRDICLDMIAAHCFTNSSYLSYIFKKKTQISISEQINLARIVRAKYLLSVTNKSITDIAYDVGYNDPSYFSRIFKKIVGVSPKIYKKM